ncbi:YozQ family protein [Ammoniphilus sp. YIM 78166]|uniref:YozQ family protein n=1 Tax=Ammoniphilus sp. YIM 78166 TaxID=1644106 RepID=UPI00106F9528|nr:YozQ family protein [Ammoniphilus sp. YIM 78166]
MNKSNFSTNENLAEKMYEPKDYTSDSALDQGLATTHEQVSDAYMEGTVDAEIENVQGTGQAQRIPREPNQQG